MDYGEFNTRKEYLAHLAETFGLPYRVVVAWAQALGPEEDFDGLIPILEETSWSDEYA